MSQFDVPVLILSVIACFRLIMYSYNLSILISNYSSRGENVETVSVDVQDSQEFVNFEMPAKSIVSVLMNTAVTAN